MFCIEDKILPACFISIVIPARDEALHLEKTLAAFSKQVDLNGNILDSDSFEIIVLTNNCSDNSYEIARKFKIENESLNLHTADINTSQTNANSGFIRRILMRKAYERLISNKRKGGIILTTDGDTQVATNWIAANVFEIKNGADAVGGRILFTAAELEKMNSSARRFHLIDEKYRLLSAELESILDRLPHDAFPRHHQHFHGSFAVTTDAYRKAGGVPDVRFLEDAAFYQSLLRVDAKFRHSPLVKVYT
ncbi:MAG: glycosyltransferase, partial [Pyrinomonadaceae bacterium]